MFFNPSMLAFTLATNVVSPFTAECVICQQETVYMPDVPQPEMTLITEPVVREIALAPDDPALTYYVPPVRSEQLLSKKSLLDLLRVMVQTSDIQSTIKEDILVDIYPSESDLNNNVWVTDRKTQNGAQNKIESLRPSDRKTKKPQQSQFYTI